MKIKVKQSLVTSRIDFFYYAFRNILIISIPLVIISAIILSSLHISADAPNNGSGSSTDTLSFNISSSCTLSSVVDRNHNAELINGTYVDGIGQTTITTLCNDGNGYSIYANGYSNNEEGNNKLVNTENSNFNIVSGTAQSGTTSNWAMSLNNLADDPSLTPPTIENTYNNTYGIVPNEWTKVASLPARATDMVKGSSFTTTYAVYTSSSQYAGTYNGQVKYMLVHPNINEPTLNNLESAFASHGIQPAYQDETGSYFAMQDMSTEICNSVSGDGETTATQLVDTRDNKLYWVTKLKDGHCWMTQNLDLDLDPAKPLTSNDTDIDITASGEGAYVAGYAQKDGVWAWTPNNMTSRTVVDYQNNTATGWQHSDFTPFSAESGDVYFYTSSSNDNDTRFDSLQACKNSGHTEKKCRHYHAGNYYNWTAAIASNSSNEINQGYGYASNSLCPKNWRLPIATNKDRSKYEFGDLLFEENIIISKTDNTYAANGFNNIRKAPIWFVRGGYIYTGSLYTVASRGLYWSSIIQSMYFPYYFYFDLNNVDPISSDGSGNRGVGKSIRCLAR